MNERYSCWLIDNVKSLSSEFKISIEEEDIELLVTDYKGLQTVSSELKEWLLHFVVDHGMQNSTNSALPINCIFIITIKPYSLSDNSFDPNLFQKCLKMSFFPPAHVSTPGNLIPNGAAAGPSWVDYRMNKSIVIETVNPVTLQKTIDIFRILRNKKKESYYILDEIFKLSNINDVLIELLSIWSFIEGFWFVDKGQNSNVTDSFKAMIKELTPGKEGRSKRIMIEKRIENQNSKVRNSRIDDMRHILAHGMYKNMEEHWSTEQWKAIYDQRNTLVKITLEALLRRIEKTA